ncbi:MAG: metallophosphoesterase [Chitinophagales bacterium]
MKYEIPFLARPPKGRRIAIGDIHGCIITLKTLLKKLDLTLQDQLFLLGDLIDKGINSKQVVDYILQLKRMDFSIFTLKGNHEQSFLTAYDCGWSFFMDYLEQNNTSDFLGDELETYLQFFSSMEYAYDLGDWLVSHTEFLIDEHSIYRGMRGLFSRVDFDIDKNELLKKRQVVGHFVTSIDKIQSNIAAKNRVICIDSGCIYNKIESLGYLSAFNLDTDELILQ